MEISNSTVKFDDWIKDMIDNNNNSAKKLTFKEVDLDDIETIRSDEIEFMFRYKGIKIGDTFPLLFISLSVLIVLLSLLCIIYLIRFGKHKKNVLYSILFHFFFIKIIFSITSCVSILMLGLFSQSKFYIRPSTDVCILERFFFFISDASLHFYLLLMWLILLSQRNIINLEFLYCDFNQHIIKKNGQDTNANNSLAINNTGNSNSTTNESLNSNIEIEQQQQQQQQQRRSQTTSNNEEKKGCIERLKLKSRKILLTSFYISLTILSFKAAIHYSAVSVFRSPICAMLKPHLFTHLAYILMFFFPIVYWIFFLSVVFWNFFGGNKDPLADKLDDTDKALLKFIKLASILKSLEMFFSHLQSIFYGVIDVTLLELSKASVFFLSLATVILFMYYENIFMALKRSVFMRTKAVRENKFIFRNRDRSE
jgi:hypothetical protein